MLSRRNSVEDRLNVGPGQYSPEFSYGKDKSPAFRYFSSHEVCAQNMILVTVYAFLVQGSMNINLISLSNKEDMISEKKLDQRTMPAESQVLDHTNMKMQFSNMDQRWNPAMDLAQDSP